MSIFQACKFLDEKWNPKFVVIVAQKNHHTKFFQKGSPDNVPPGRTLKELSILLNRLVDLVLEYVLVIHLLLQVLS